VVWCGVVWCGVVWVGVGVVVWVWCCVWYTRNNLKNHKTSKLYIYSNIQEVRAAQACIETFAKQETETTNGLRVSFVSLRRRRMRSLHEDAPKDLKTKNF
jgi:hypothetical protein